LALAWRGGEITRSTCRRQSPDSAELTIARIRPALARASIWPWPRRPATRMSREIP